VLDDLSGNVRANLSAYGIPSGTHYTTTV